MIGDVNNEAILYSLQTAHRLRPMARKRFLSTSAFADYVGLLSSLTSRSLYSVLTPFEISAFSSTFTGGAFSTSTLASVPLRHTNAASLGLHSLASADDEYTRLLADFPTLSTPNLSAAYSKHGVEHFITTKGAPVQPRALRLSPDKLAIARREFENMQKLGIVRRSCSAWASPLHMVPKKPGDWRPCGDYRRLNDVGVADRYPIPHIPDFAAQLQCSSIFSKIDLIKGCHQIHVAAEDVHKTVIITPFGLFEFVRMPFGLRNSAQSFHDSWAMYCKALPSSSSTLMTF